MKMPRNGYYMPQPATIFYTFNQENADTQIRLTLVIFLFFLHAV